MPRAPTFASSGSLWSLRSLQTSFVSGRISYKWNLLFFYGWLFSPCPDFRDSSILLRPQFVSPFSCGWTQAAVNIFVQASSRRSLLGKYLQVQLCSLRVNGCLNLTGLDSFQSGYTILRFPQRKLRVLVVLYPYLSMMLPVVNFLNFSHSDGTLWYFIMALSCILLTSNDIV